MGVAAISADRRLITYLTSRGSMTINLFQISSLFAIQSAFQASNCGRASGGGISILACSSSRILSYRPSIATKACFRVNACRCTPASWLSWGILTLADLADGTARTGLGPATLVRETRPSAPCRAATHQLKFAR
jgi:hypothetical protein